MLALIRTGLSRLRGLLLQRRLDQDSDEEFQAHLAMLADRFVRQGMTPEEAHHAAKRQFGGITQMSERLRDRRSLPSIEAIFQDIRYAFRQLRKAPAFTIAAVATLALGIGATTAVFAVVNAVLLRPLPFPEPDRLVAFHSHDVRTAPHPSPLSYPNFFDFRSQNQVFEHLVCYRDSQFSLAGPAGATHVDGEIVSWDLFSALRVQPELGRGFVPDEEKAGTHVVVLSHNLWQRHFGGDNNIVGRNVTINGKLFRVVGIAPRDFHFPTASPAVGLWTTLAEDASFSEFTPMTAQRGARVLDAIGRLKPGITVEKARAQMDAIAGGLAKAYPDENKNTPTTYVRSEIERLTGETRAPMMILLGAVGLVLLIACANIANLLLARSIERQREFAVRTAIGASRWTVIRQLLTESLLLASLGCAAGVLLALTCLRFVLPLAGDTIPRITEASVDPHVLAFSIALAVFTSILFSLAPAMQVAKTDVISSLKDGTRGITRGHQRLRRTLVIGQISLGLVLLSGAALLTASFLYLMRRDPGLRPDHLLTFNLSLPDGYNMSKQIAFSDRLMERMRALPGVESAAAGFPLPLTGDQMSVSFDIKERPAAPPDRPHADIAIVTPRYFHTLGIALLKGRDFTERDDAKAPPVLVVNKAFADKYFPGENIIGKRIQSGATNGTGHTVVSEIVGVVGNAKQTALRPGDDPIYYFPYKQLSWGIGTIALRTSVPPRAVEAAARAAVMSLEPQAPVYEVREMEDLASAAIARPRFQMLLLGSFAGIALLLTVVGLYGVLAYSVMKRTREIGVRIALGASRSMVLGMVLREAMILLVAGLALGVAGAAASGHLLEKMLYGITPRNPLLLIVACCTITVTSLIAAYLPALRAASVDPLQALRVE
jgi:putative ABC transport system permease protein